MTTQNTTPPAEQSQPKDLLTVNEVADQLLVDPSTVRRWCNQGAIDVVELPKRGKRHKYRIKQSTIESLFKPARRSK